MLNTGTQIKQTRGALAATLSPIGSDVRMSAADAQESRAAAERAVDEVLAESFPASDPPSWTPGIVRPDPAATVVITRPAGDSRADTRRADTQRIGAAVGSPSSRGTRAFLDVVSSLVGVSGIALLVPLVILLVGLPIALAVRGFVEAIAWLAAFFSL